MVAEREWIYNGLSMGIDTNIRVVSVEGLYSTDARGSEIDKAMEDGAHIEYPVLGPKRIIMSGNTYHEDEETFAADIAEMRKAFNPPPAILPLQFLLPGETERSIFCLPRRKDLPTDLDYVQSNLCRWTVELIAGDPRVYSIDEHLLEGAGVVENAGDYRTPPVFVINGPSNDPIVTNQTTGKFIQYEGVVGAGQQLLFDIPRKLMRLDGVSVYGDRDINSEWFMLEPGNNILLFGGGGTLETRWRDAWA